MKWTRNFLFLGKIATVLLFAGGGRFPLGIFMAVWLCLLLCVLEPIAVN